MELRRQVSGRLNVLSHTHTICFEILLLFIQAVPGDKTVSILKRGDWRSVCDLKGHTANTTIAVFSPNAKYIATTGEDNRVNVFDISTKDVIGYTDLETQATGMILLYEMYSVT